MARTKTNAQNSTKTHRTQRRNRHKKTICLCFSASTSFIMLIFFSWFWPSMVFVFQRYSVPYIPTFYQNITWKLKNQVSQTSSHKQISIKFGHLPGMLSYFIHLYFFCTCSGFFCIRRVLTMIFFSGILNTYRTSRLQHLSTHIQKIKCIFSCHKECNNIKYHHLFTGKTRKYC